MRASTVFSAGLCGLALIFAGCATSDSGDAASVRRSLPDAIGARFTPPEFATRNVDGERVAVLDASLAAANALGYSVSRFDGARGRISASRRQVSSFDGARQNTLEITVRSFAPGSSQVGIVLREATESDDRNSNSGALTASALVRDRVPYDVFFERLAATLGKTSSASSTSTAP